MATKGKQASKIVEVPKDQMGFDMPHKIEFEEAVLGALLVEQEAFIKIEDILTPNTFYDHRHQLIFQAIASLYKNNQPIDVVTVPEELRRMGTLEEVGGPLYIAQLAENVVSSAHIVYHAHILHEKYVQRRIIEICNKAIKESFDLNCDAADQLKSLENDIFGISQETQKSDYTQINPIIAQAYELMKQAASRKDGMSGLPSGFPALDKITNGWQASDLIIIAARPGMGKTAFVLSMLKNMVMDYQIPIAMFSLEMSSLQLANRLIINICSIPGDRFKTGDLQPYEWAQLDNLATRLHNDLVYLDDTPGLSIFELHSKARRLVKEHGVKMIIIDYLQLMSDSGMSRGNRQEQVSVISRHLKGLAKELNIPVIALSQLNREVDKRDGEEGKRPQLSDLRESGAIEQDADIVCFIHRPEVYKLYKDSKGRDMRGMAEFIIAKHRNGAVDDVLLKFQGQYARFENPEDGNHRPAETASVLYQESTPPSELLDGVAFPDDLIP